MRSVAVMWRDSVPKLAYSSTTHSKVCTFSSPKENIFQGSSISRHIGTQQVFQAVHCLKRGCHVTCGNDASLRHWHVTPAPAIHWYQYNNYIHHVMPICMYFFYLFNKVIVNKNTLWVYMKNRKSLLSLYSAKNNLETLSLHTHLANDIYVY